MTPYRGTSTCWACNTLPYGTVIQDRICPKCGAEQSVVGYRQRAIELSKAAVREILRRRYAERG